MRDNNVRAKEEITKAIELNPNRPRFYHFRGNINIYYCLKLITKLSHPGFIEKDFDSEMKDYGKYLFLVNTLINTNSCAVRGNFKASSNLPPNVYDLQQYGIRQVEDSAVRRGHGALFEGH
jgi:hypothetical protein